ncbi:UNVERIFIED_CONTAM: hypothetical protein K2H54_039019 [Gekko kuhli]
MAATSQSKHRTHYKDGDGLQRPNPHTDCPDAAGYSGAGQIRQAQTEADCGDTDANGGGSDEEKPCSPLEGRSPNLGTCTQHGVRIETDFIDTDGRSGTDTPIRLGIDHGPGKVSD